MLCIPFIFTPAFPLEMSLVAAAVLGPLGIPHGQHQFQIVRYFFWLHIKARPSMFEDVYITPRPWKTSEPLFRGFSQLELPRQSFVGEFSEHGRNRYIDICALSIQRRCGSTFRALRISQLRTLWRSVTPRTHRKNLSATCT